MDISNVIKQLQTILPTENFLKEPETSIRELQHFEKKYKLNTIDFIEKKYKDELVDLEDVEEWLNSYENFLFFEGNETLINTIQNDTDTAEQYINNKDLSFEEYLFKLLEEANPYSPEFASSIFSSTTPSIR